MWVKDTALKMYENIGKVVSDVGQGNNLENFPELYSIAYGQANDLESFSGNICEGGRKSFRPQREDAEKNPAYYLKWLQGLCSGKRSL